MKLKTVAIVPSAGTGKRLGLKIKKPFVLLKGVPLIARTLKALDSSRHIDSIVVACDKRSRPRFKGLVKKYRIKKVVDIVIGGKTRFESVRNCLDMAGSAYDIALIHDGARPFVEERLIRDSIRLAKEFGGCVVALPASDTVKLVSKDMFVKKTIDRKMVYRAQTPQTFRLDLIKKAYMAKKMRHATDDSGLFEAMGRKVKVLKGSCRNIKVTTKEDLKIAEVLI